jgi:acyl-coenzyme A thioesterase PaaI-like protein
VLRLDGVFIHLEKSQVRFLITQAALHFQPHGQTIQGVSFEVEDVALVALGNRHRAVLPVKARLPDFVEPRDP